MSPEACLAPLDGLRAGVLGAFARAGGRRLLADRALRVATAGVVAVALSFFFACAAPEALLTLGPVLFGIPHLLADLRYGIVQPGLHRRTAPAFLVVALGLLGVVWPYAALRLAAGLVTLAFSPASVARRLSAAGAWLVLMAVCARHEVVATAVLVHVHHAVALGFWLVWARTPRSHAAPVLLVFAAACAALLAGAADPGWTASQAFASPAPGADLSTLCRALAPWASPAAARRWVALFAFAQSVHYAVWLRIIPDERRSRPGVRSFASSYRVLVADLGAPTVLGFAAASVALLAFACCDGPAARGMYLRLGGFHGYVELAPALAWLAQWPGTSRAR